MANKKTGRCKQYKTLADPQPLCSSAKTKMNTKLCIPVLFLVIATGLLCTTEGRKEHEHGGRLTRASDVNIQNWCGNSIGREVAAHVGGENNTSKINIPTLCVKCDFCASPPCYCCVVTKPQHCWTSQTDCINQCKP